MGEIRRLAGGETAEREASAWIARIHADDVTPDDVARCEAWIRANPRNAKAYAELSTMRQKLIKAGPVVRAVSFGQAMNEASEAPPRWRRWAVATFAAGVAAITFAVWHRPLPQREFGFRTPIGEESSAPLPDGSSLNLNTNSRVRVDYSAHDRVVRLERGEVFFTVQHNESRPFWVQAGDVWIRDVGTAFNVHLTSSGPVITVADGVVRIVGSSVSGPSPPSDSAATELGPIVKAGEQLAVDGGAEAVRTLSAEEVNRLLAWRQGILYFQDQPLSEVIADVGRYTTLKIELRDPSLRRLPVGGTFKASPQGAEALLTLLHVGFGARIQRGQDGHVYVEGRPK